MLKRLHILNWSLPPRAGSRQTLRTRAISAARLLIVTALAVLTFHVLIPAGATAHQPRSVLPSAVDRVQGQVVIAARARQRSIPASFLGISTEYWALPQWARHVSVLDRVLSLIRGPGALVLRIGGDSADRTFWGPAHKPEWAFEVTPAWLREVRAIVHHTGARLILDLNLVTASPAIAARWAHIAATSLPTGSIRGFEIGNEPDLYNRSSWQSLTAEGTGFRALPNQITPRSYASSFLAYSRALTAAAPAVPLLGPALSHPVTSQNWIARLLNDPHPGLAAITVHRYPYSSCAAPGQPTYPTIERLLSNQATIGMAASVRTAHQLASRAGLPLRVTELNSVTCGGTLGVSNTFATSLWAPNALFALAKAGVASADIHVRADATNAAFTIDHHGLTAHPLLYGMILFKRTLGPDAQLIPVRLHAAHPLALSVWAVRSAPNVLHVLLINRGRRQLRLSLKLPVTGTAAVQRLLAPSVQASDGVTLAGQHLGSNGRWVGAFHSQTIHPAAGHLTVTVPAYSAALMTTKIEAGALATPAYPSSPASPG